MKQIILIRHTKASQNLIFDDFDRPIIEEGIENSIKIASKTLAFYKNLSDIYIASSSAKRTLQTSKIFSEIWNINFKLINLYDELYTFNEAKLFNFVQNFPFSNKTLIIFGHNNAITDFVNKYGDIFIENVPTSGLVSIIFEIDKWSQINKGKTNNIIFPKHIL